MSERERERTFSEDGPHHDQQSNDNGYCQLSPPVQYAYSRTLTPWNVAPSVKTRVLGANLPGCQWGIKLKLVPIRTGDDANDHREEDEYR